MSDAGARLSGGTTIVVMVQTTHVRDGDDRAVEDPIVGHRPAGHATSTEDWIGTSMGAT
jgi:hypothetical protein